MQTINHPKHHMEVFTSYGEFVAYAGDNPEPKSSNKDGGSGWQGGTKTLTEAASLATEGWSEIRPEVDNLLDTVTERLAERLSNLYVPRYDYGGAYVDMGKFLQGDPECMVTFNAEPAGAMGRVVKIAVAITASSMIDPDDIKRRGVAILALVDTITKLGCGVEVWVDSTIRGTGDKRFTTAVKLHDSNDTLDINSIMFGLAHPSMLRRLVFSIQERSPKAKEQGVGGGYGYPDKIGITANQEFDVVVEKLQDGYGDIVRNPFEWVMTTVKGLGIVDDNA